MKVLGLSCGRKMQNTEILVKEALMAAEDSGMDVEFTRILDLEIKPCRFCMPCLFQQKGECIIKDDAMFLYNLIMDSDGFIIGAPVYSLTPPGILKMFEDRMMGPKTDVAFLIEQKKLGGKDRMGNPRWIDERAFKNRVGGFISLGGASTPNWLSFGLPLLYTMTFPPQIDVIDQMQVIRVGQFGHTSKHQKALTRARHLGRNVAEAMKKPLSERKWLGDPGICPVCHSNLLTVNGKNPVECPICGISGTLKVDGDKITVDFSLKEQARSRLTLAGKLEHWVELSQSFQHLRNLDMAEIQKSLDKYKDYKEVKKPPKAPVKK
jgi:multimeric flavodoxin WrbA